MAKGKSASEETTLQPLFRLIPLRPDRDERVVLPGLGHWLAPRCVARVLPELSLTPQPSSACTSRSAPNMDLLAGLLFS